MDVDSQSQHLRNTFSEIEAAPTVAVALEIFQSAYQIDFVTYHLAQTVADVIDTPFVRTTYSDAWVSRYLLSCYVKVDPIVRQGFLRQMPFDWSEVEISDAAHAFLEDAEKHGLGVNGFSIPIVDKARRALFSLNSKAMDNEWSRLVARDRGEWIELAHLIHKKAVFEAYRDHDPVPLLGQREIECLYWAALGNDAKGISTILGLSEHTTRSYLKSARLKLGCLTTTAATVRATQLRIINPYGNTLI
ncbi:LuxR family transcriptional regulator [Agrobacterium arsenijevicii]|uniref:LuxR family transcriptional regulator n=1 Tax=Agrobacterium arsenijevicii TaxID=1585697 RepID=A0ABR5CZJ6_9HYPH|nr:LuxR family transcriptional regulator [Agrobacterium arsenijevicii]